MYNYEKTINFIVMHVFNLLLCSSNIPKPQKTIKFNYMKPIFIYNIYIYKKKANLSYSRGIDSYPVLQLYLSRDVYSKKIYLYRGTG